MQIMTNPKRKQLIVGIITCILLIAVLLNYFMTNRKVNSKSNPEILNNYQYYETQSIQMGLHKSIVAFTSKSRDDCTMEDLEREPIVIRLTGGLLRRITLNDLIEESTLIVIGNGTEKHISFWTTEDGMYPKGDIGELARRKFRIFTDTLFSVNKVIFGKTTEKEIIIRELGGQVCNDQYIQDDSISLEKKNTYLLFLVRVADDRLPEVKEAHGAYFIIGGNIGAFEIEREYAVSPKYAMPLEKLLKYINEIKLVGHNISQQ